MSSIAAPEASPRPRWSRRMSPQCCYVAAGRCMPWLWAAAALAATAGLAIGLAIAPDDATQGDGYRIVFFHAPAAMVSMLLYAMLAACALGALVRSTRMPALLVRAVAPTGALMAFLALWTGALWARATRGVWWAWDAGFVAGALSFALCLGVLALHATLDEPRRRDRAAALLAVMGGVGVATTVNLPWGASLHGGATFDAPLSLTGSHAWGLASMGVAFAAWSIAAVLHRLRSIVLERENGAEWVRHLPELAR
ncbi:MAG: cytochrome c biogenesis protein [Aquincola sp.]|nr:cytochrome c biogenesis protein [Aquincola sp.]MDH4288957.1 cytochrome c biogenesis protein [Aquincola sp.]MDH5331269.1 cytochrome c biogenesis protein [Aquincola sp.]